MIYHTDRFANVEPPLHPRDESHLVMMDNPFNVLLDSPVDFHCMWAERGGMSGVFIALSAH